jgi:hypothetical protein
MSKISCHLPKRSSTCSSTDRKASKKRFITGWPSRLSGRVFLMAAAPRIASLKRPVCRDTYAHDTVIASTLCKQNS